MSVQITSTTDSVEEVNAALGNQPPAKQTVEEKLSASAPEETPESDETGEESETSEDVSEESDAEELEASETEEGEPKDEEQKPKKKGGVQKRIGKLVSKLSAAEQEIQRLRTISEVKAEKPQVVIEAKIESQGEPKADDFDTNAEFVRAMAKWEVQEARAADQKAANEQHLKDDYQKAMNAHQARVDSFKKENNDYVDVIQEFMADHGDLQFSPALNEAILSSDLGPALIYELAKKPDELMRINALSYGAAQREIGRLEARLEGSPQKKEPETKMKTKAPAPITPVGSRSSGKSAKNPEDMSFQEYKGWRESQK